MKKIFYAFCTIAVTVTGYSFVQRITAMSPEVIAKLIDERDFHREKLFHRFSFYVRSDVNTMRDTIELLKSACAEWFNYDTCDYSIITRHIDRTQFTYYPAAQTLTVAIFHFKGYNRTRKANAPLETKISWTGIYDGPNVYKLQNRTP